MIEIIENEDRSSIPSEFLTARLTPRYFIGTTWLILGKSLRPLLGIIVTAYLPLYLILSIASRGAVVLGLPQHIQQLANWFLIPLLLALPHLATAIIVEESLMGKEIRYGHIMSRAFTRWGTAIWAIILLHLVVVGGTILFIVPGIMYLVYYSFCIQAVALRNQTGRLALDYSKSIVGDRWWDVLAFVMIMAIIYILLNLPYIILYIWMRPEDSILSRIIPAPLYCILSCLLTIIATILFLNLEYSRSFQSDTQPAKPSPAGIASAVIPFAYLGLIIGVGALMKFEILHKNSNFFFFIAIPVLLLSLSPFIGLVLGILDLRAGNSKKSPAIIGVILNGIICAPCILSPIIMILKRIFT